MAKWMVDHAEQFHAVFDDRIDSEKEALFSVSQGNRSFIYFCKFQ
jgi:hypothetical protein